MQYIQDEWMSDQLTDETRKSTVLLQLKNHPDVIPNKYFAIYCDLILREYDSVITEDHHIFPDCLEGSSDLPCNFVKLPVRHHFVAHLCLARCTRGQTRYKMIAACNLFSLARKGRVSSRLVESIRRLNAEYARARETGKVKSEETRKRMSKGQTGVKKEYTPETLARRIEKFQQTYTERELKPWNAGKTMEDDQNVRRLSAGKTKGVAHVVIEPDNTTYLIPNLMALYCKQRSLWIQSYMNQRLKDRDAIDVKGYIIRRYESLAEARDAFPSAIEWTPEIEAKIFEYDKSAAMTGKKRGLYRKG